MATHKFTTELNELNSYIPFEEWVQEKLNNNETLVKEVLNSGSTGHEFSSFYDYWMNEFKMSHVITEDNGDSRTISYKTLTPERIAFAMNVVNTLSSGGTLSPFN